MKQVLVDMDGVLADVYSQFIHYELKQTGIQLNLKELFGRKENEAFPNFLIHVQSKGFFRSVPTIPDSIDGLRYLNDKYNVLIVSSATEFPNSLKEKLEWLNEFYPFISWQQMIFCGSKSSITGDIMIDDHPKNLDHFNGERILFTQPHNIYIEDNSYTRMDNWRIIIDTL